MRNYILVLVAIITIISCSKDDESSKDSCCSKGEESYDNGKGAILNLTSQRWTLEGNALGGVNAAVNIAGAIEGDSASIRTFGDGLISDAKIKLNSKKEFNQNFEIFFTSSQLLEEYITANTLIMVFEGKDTLKVEVNSCPLQNIAF